MQTRCLADANVLHMAKQIFLGNVPPLRVGFSSFVASRHLQMFKAGYESQFPGCVLQLSGGVTASVLQKLERVELDCGIVPLPILGSQWHVTHLESSPLVTCMRSDDPLAAQSFVTLFDLEKRLSILPRPRGTSLGSQSLVADVWRSWNHAAHLMLRNNSA
jgi:DNA-binding transcriptional LysR family regulator